MGKQIQPKPLKIWTAAGRVFTTVAGANRAAQRRAVKIGRPAYVCKLSISAVTSRATRIGLHTVDADGEIVVLPTDTPLYARSE